ncbi:MAG: hypothetical protein MR968_01100 [Prevotella sp.]|nr:hypothetical protein [Prevotella sp.]MCI7044864.1 hypothetical protein [Prevotella sp.]
MKRKGLYGEKQQPIRMDRSDEGRQAITRTIVEGVIKYIESRKVDFSASFYDHKC